MERYDTPRERLLAVFEGQGELFAQPDYRGCAFARASAESHPGDLAEQAAEAYRRWVRALLTELAAQAGVPEPEVLARQLHLLYDGSGQSARMDHDPAAAAAARAAAAILLDAALAPLAWPPPSASARRLATERPVVLLPSEPQRPHGAMHQAARPGTRAAATQHGDRARGRRRQVQQRGLARAVRAASAATCQRGFPHSQAACATTRRAGQSAVSGLRRSESAVG